MTDNMAPAPPHLQDGPHERADQIITGHCEKGCCISLVLADMEDRVDAWAVLAPDEAERLAVDLMQRARAARAARRVKH